MFLLVFFFKKPEHKNRKKKSKPFKSVFYFCCHFVTSSWKLENFKKAICLPLRDSFTAQILLSNRYRHRSGYCGFKTKSCSPISAWQKRKGNSDCCLMVSSKEKTPDPKQYIAVHSLRLAIRKWHSVFPNYAHKQKGFYTQNVFHEPLRSYCKSKTPIPALFIRLPFTIEWQSWDNFCFHCLVDNSAGGMVKQETLLIPL